ncbi:RDD family protein [Canibacter zhoujuaniae]|uniref:RDD family protein n=1 Tax=Canibacter zhoujuaniae TaxID=2708343 RepID=UPI00142367E6|nr:RDD family protein [Canibacter zhoujuaniae]
MASKQQGVKFGDVSPSKYPGERLGLNESGARSIGRIGRRLGAIFVDWGLATAIVYWQSGGRIEPLNQLIVFALMQMVMLLTVRGSVGHYIFGLRLASIYAEKDGYLQWLWRPIVRTLLLCLVVPALVWDSDQRGFHDKIAGTVLIRP